MTQAELNCAVAEATGESIKTIAQWGFIPLTAIPNEQEPPWMDDGDSYVSWDGDCVSRTR